MEESTADFTMTTITLDSSNLVEVYKNWNIHIRPMNKAAYEGDTYLHSCCAIERLQYADGSPVNGLYGYGNSDTEAISAVKEKIDKGVV